MTLDNRSVPPPAAGLVSAGRVVLYDRVTELEFYDPLAVGDTFDVVRGNGRREGDWMGTATVIALDDNDPVLEVRLEAGVRR